MTDTGWIALVSGILSVILIPLAVLVLRGAVKWTRIEDRLEEIAEDLANLVTQVKEERTELSRRLRWLEENIWKRRQPRPPRRDPPPS